MSGMLSKKAEMKPSASADTHEAGGSLSTGIIEAHSTSDSRKTEPLMVSGSTSQSWRRTPTVIMMATHTATPMKGKCSASSG